MSICVFSYTLLYIWFRHPLDQHCQILFQVSVCFGFGSNNCCGMSHFYDFAKFFCFIVDRFLFLMMTMSPWFIYTSGVSSFLFLYRSLLASFNLRSSWRIWSRCSLSCLNWSSSFLLLVLVRSSSTGCIRENPSRSAGQILDCPANGMELIILHV